MSVHVVAKGGKGLSGPTFTGDGRLIVCGGQDGSVYLEDSNTLLPYASTAGSPVGAVVDHSGSIFVFDSAAQAVLLLPDSQAIITDYEGKQFLGPHSGVFDSAGQLFFTDSGPFGETSLERPRGSVYIVSGDGGNRLLRPIASDCLAYPTGIALNGDDTCLYVAEMGANRILRAVQRPANVWHFHVWHTFQGRMGPAAVVADHGRGLLYVARSEVPELSSVGVISVLSPTGELLKDIELPGYPELSGMCLTPDNTALIVTESSTNSVLRVHL